MIAAAPPAAAPPQAHLHAAFLALLPQIELCARIAFRDLRCPDKKEEAVAEAVALTWKWFTRLAERGKDPTRFSPVLAAFAARAVRCGRRLCGQERAQDVMSVAAQRRHGFRVTGLPRASTPSDSPWDEALHDNTASPVPD